MSKEKLEILIDALASAGFEIDELNVVDYLSQSIFIKIFPLSSEKNSES
jgi:hypothetical protein